MPLYNIVIVGMYSIENVSYNDMYTLSATVPHIKVGICILKTATGICN